MTPANQAGRGVEPRIRRQAIQILRVVASNRKRCGTCWAAAHALGFSRHVASFAHRVWAEAVLTEKDSELRHAEAEAMLHCGWRPGCQRRVR